MKVLVLSEESERDDSPTQRCGKYTRQLSFTPLKF